MEESADEAVEEGGDVEDVPRLQGGSPGHRRDLSGNDVRRCRGFFLPLHGKRPGVRKPLVQLFACPLARSRPTPGARWRKGTSSTSREAWWTSSYASKTLDIQRLDAGVLRKYSHCAQNEMKVRMGDFERASEKV